MARIRPTLWDKIRHGSIDEKLGVALKLLGCLALAVYIITALF